MFYVRITTVLLLDLNIFHLITIKNKENECSFIYFWNFILFSCTYIQYR